MQTRFKFYHNFSVKTPDETSPVYAAVRVSMIFQQRLVMILRRICFIHSDSIPYGNTTADL